MRLRSLFGFVFAGLLVLACSSSDDGGAAATPTKRGVKAGDVCDPGATQECKGPGACVGAQICKDDGSGYGACDCGNGQPAGGSPGASGSAGTTSGTAGTTSGTAGTGGTGGSGAAGNGASGAAGTNTGVGGSMSSGGAAGTGSSGTPGSACDLGAPGSGCEACGTCSQSSICKTEWKATTDEATFGDFGFCLLACSGDQTCLAQCDADYPLASAAYGKFIVCSVCKACPVTCVKDNLAECKQ